MSRNKVNLVIPQQSCRDFDDFLARSRALLNPTHAWVFRGQGEDSDFFNDQRLLCTSFERACQRFGVEPSRRAELERQMIREFQRHLHHYSTNVPDITLYDEWISLMQHYGATTRFLDFTYSSYVAAYFAFEHAKAGSEISIWAIDSTWCTERLAEIDRDLAARYSSYWEKRGHEDFKAIFMQSQPQKLVLSVNPFRLNERLAYQKGVFLCPGDISTTFMENLLAFAEADGLQQCIIQYTIPAGEKGEIRNAALIELERMNINRITLFPGLEGFVQSLPVKIITQFLPLQEMK